MNGGAVAGLVQVWTRCRTFHTHIVLILTFTTLIFPSSRAAQLEMGVSGHTYYGHDWLDDHLLLAGGAEGRLVLWDVRSASAPLAGWALAGAAALGGVKLHKRTSSGYLFATSGESAGLYHVCAGS